MDLCIHFRVIFRSPADWMAELTGRGYCCSQARRLRAKERVLRFTQKKKKSGMYQQTKYTVITQNAQSRTNSTKQPISVRVFL